MRELIERYVRELVKIPSTSNTETEKSCADYIAEELAKQPYFKEYQENISCRKTALAGLYHGDW